MNLTKTNQKFSYLSKLLLLHYNPTHMEQMMHKNQWGLSPWLLLLMVILLSSDVPFWVQFSCALAMGLGTSIGGWKIIKTVGGKIMKIRPVNGVAADLTGALLFLVPPTIHLPVSTTHVISLRYIRCWIFPSSKRSEMGNSPTDADYLGHYTPNLSNISRINLLSIKPILLIIPLECFKNNGIVTNVFKTPFLFCPNPLL